MADNDFEKLIEDEFERCKKKNLAHFDKLYPPFTWFGRSIRLIKKSTVDYVGVCKGSYIAIEAKDCEKEEFPMANIEKHQIDHLNSVIGHNGYGFLLVRMTKFDKVYLIPITSKWLKVHWNKKRRPSMDKRSLERYGIVVVSMNIVQAIDEYIDNWVV